MSDFGNVSLWFAKNENNELVTIDKLNDNYEGKYHCPLCGSEVIPKAVNSNKISPHFAHLDRESCSGETLVHWWVKNQLIKEGDVVEIITNETKQVMCKYILLEQVYDTPYGKYKPDITMITYDDERIFVEINYTNKKNIKNYYSKWNCLGSTVIEFTVGKIHNVAKNKIDISNSFKAIYYKGGDIDKESSDYKSYRNSINEWLLSSEIKRVRGIEWFIDDIYRYNMGFVDICQLEESFKWVEDTDILYSIHKRNRKCQNALNDIVKKRDNCIADLIRFLNENNIDSSFEPWNEKRLVKSRLVGSNSIDVYFDFVDVWEFKITPYDYLEKIEEIKSLVGVDLDIVNKRNAIYDFCKMIDCRYEPNVKYYKNLKSFTFTLRNFAFEIKNNHVYIGNVKIRKISNFNTVSEFSDIITPILNMLLDDEFVLFNENIIEIFNKIKYIFNNCTFIKYKCYVDDSDIVIKDKRNGYAVSVVRYDSDSTYDEIMDVISKDVRKYLYGSEE